MLFDHFFLFKLFLRLWYILHSLLLDLHLFHWGLFVITIRNLVKLGKIMSCSFIIILLLEYNGMLMFWDRLVLFSFFVLYYSIVLFLNFYLFLLFHLFCFLRSLIGCLLQLFISFSDLFYQQRNSLIFLFVDFSHPPFFLFFLVSLRLSFVHGIDFMFLFFLFKSWIPLFFILENFFQNSFFHRLLKQFHLQFFGLSFFSQELNFVFFPLSFLL